MWEKILTAYLIICILCVIYGIIFIGPASIIIAPFIFIFGPFILIFVTLSKIFGWKNFEIGGK